jgi:hypothetical protein
MWWSWMFFFYQNFFCTNAFFLVRLCTSCLYQRTSCLYQRTFYLLLTSKLCFRWTGLSIKPLISLKILLDPYGNQTTPIQIPLVYQSDKMLFPKNQCCKEGPMQYHCILLESFESEETSTESMPLQVTAHHDVAGSDKSTLLNTH